MVKLSIVTRIMKRHSRFSLHPSGFSLIEVLTVIAVLGVILSLALPWFGKHGDDFRRTRDQRNAQSICTLCQALQSTGVTLVSEGSTSLEVARAIAQGVTVNEGSLRGQTFRVPGLGEEELKGAARFIFIQGQQVLYAAPEVQG